MKGREMAGDYSALFPVLDDLQVSQVIAKVSTTESTSI